MYLYVYEQKYPFSTIFPEEGSRGSLRNLAFWLGWSPWHATVNYVHKICVTLRSSFCVTFHKSQGHPQPLTSPYHHHLPYQLYAESVDLCGKKRTSNSWNINSLVYLPRICLYVWIHYHSDLWRMTHIRIHLCHLSFILGKRCGLKRRKSSCQLWNRPYLPSSYVRKYEFTLAPFRIGRLLPTRRHWLWRETHELLF
jgi:hypothetical protein